MEARADPFGAGELARSTGCLYLAGAALGIASLLAPSSPTAHAAALAVLGAFSAVGGALLLRFGGRLPVWVLSGAVLLATAMVTVAVVLDGHSDSVYGALYVWVVVEAWCFFTRREAIAHLASRRSPMPRL